MLQDFLVLLYQFNTAYHHRLSSAARWPWRWLRILGKSDYSDLAEAEIQMCQTFGPIGTCSYILKIYFSYFVYLYMLDIRCEKV